MTSGDPLAVLILCAVPIQAPALLTSLYVDQIASRSSTGWLLVALFGWVVLQAAAVAKAGTQNQTCWIPALSRE